MKNSSQKQKSKSINSGWVLVSEDNKKVLAHGKTLELLLKNIELKGNPKGSISIVPPPNFTSYIG